MAKDSDGVVGDSDFSATRWTLVDLAANPNPRVREEALSALLRRYLSPLHWHLVARKRFDPHRAEDLLQDFITDKILISGLFQKAIKEKGKFRSFLLVALDRFVAGKLRKERAAKRAPGSGFGRVPMEDALDIASPDPDASRAFDVKWARSVVAEAVGRVKEACLADGRNLLWELFENRIVRPTLHDAEPLSYAELAAQYQLDSAGQAANMTLTGKRMFARCLRNVVAEYTLDPGAIDEEMAELRHALAARPHL